MKREEKNQLMRRRIMERALQEFAAQGYGASSVNTICNVEDISKGIIYHYFETKDALYLACVEECFQVLTEYLKSSFQLDNGAIHKQLESYFHTRLMFFQQNPVYQKIFCQAVIMPPPHLETEVREKRREFDRFNLEILEKLLKPVVLRRGIIKEEVIETFRQYQDFMNARYQTSYGTEINLAYYEESCRKALDILLYGIVDRREAEL